MMMKMNSLHNKEEKKTRSTPNSNYMYRQHSHTPSKQKKEEVIVWMRTEMEMMREGGRGADNAAKIDEKRKK